MENAPESRPEGGSFPRIAIVVVVLVGLGVAYWQWRGSADAPPASLPAPASQQVTPAESVTAAEAAAKDRPSPENYLALSLAYDLAGRHGDNITAARQALKLRPSYAEAWNNIAAGYEGLGLWDDAIRAAEEAVKLKPDYQLAKNNLAWARKQKADAQKVKQQEPK